ncbi:MAG: HlyD family efflux transporter periplasmic adaptor subunit [Oscillospiraceae bacterium]|nr:HlyD family efflux transporter periplasmic adaptor subunit [Oscillospiraceae bacterium]
MKKYVKIIGGSLLGLAAAGGVAASMLSPLTVEVTTLMAATARVTFTEQGAYVYDRVFTVYPQVAGEVLEIQVKPGDNVTKGQVIAVISATDYEYQIKSLESTIAGYQAQINNLYAQEKISKDQYLMTRQTLLGQIADIDVGMKEYEISRKVTEKQIQLQEDIVGHNQRMVNLARENAREYWRDYRGGGIDRDEYRAYDNQAQQAVQQAEIALDASLQQLELLKAGNATMEGFRSQRDSLERQLGLVEDSLGRSNTWAMQQYYNAMIEGTQQNIESMNDMLGRAVVTAPVSGKIDALPVRDSNIVSHSISVATISNDPAVEVFVPIREIDGVRVGDTVQLIFDKQLGNETMDATVIRIEDEAQVQISALGVEERKVRVLLEPKGNISIGYSMDAVFTVFEEPDAVVVPKTAVFEQDGKDMVWLVTNGEANLREIEKGVETRYGFAVTSGLSPGDDVITDANDANVRAGRRIKTG